MIEARWRSAIHQLTTSLALVGMPVPTWRKGGPGSGNWGHGGRPGEVGGSSPGGGGSSSLLGKIPHGQRSTVGMVENFSTYEGDPQGLRDALEDFTVLPQDDDKYVYYTHFVRYPSDLDSIVEEGVQTSSSGNMWAARDTNHDLGSGFVVFRTPREEDQPERTDDPFPGGPTYDQYLFHRAIAPEDLVRVIREVPMYPGASHTIREDDLIKYALAHQDAPKAEIADLPLVYQRLFHLPQAKGGPGSGNWGHEGRPGEQGGSASGDGGGADDGGEASEGAMAPIVTGSALDRVRGGTASIPDIQEVADSSLALSEKIIGLDNESRELANKIWRANQSHQSDLVPALVEQKRGVDAQSAALQAERQAVADKFAEALKVADPTRVVGLWSTRIPPSLTNAQVTRAKAAFAKGMAQVSTLVDKSVMQGGVDAELITTGRSHANSSLISMDARANDIVAIHELGHVIELSRPEYLEAAQDFLDERTMGERPISLHNFSKGYDEDEITTPDKFISPYVGKRYGSGDEPDPVTEVISVGLAEYARAPMLFAQRDPEHFDLIYRLAHGRIHR